MPAAQPTSSCLRLRATTCGIAFASYWLAHARATPRYYSTPRVYVTAYVALPGSSTSTVQETQSLSLPLPPPIDDIHEALSAALRLAPAAYEPTLAWVARWREWLITCILDIFEPTERYRVSDS